MASCQIGKPDVLLELPNEVLALIVKALAHDRNALLGFRQTCKHALQLSEPSFCEQVTLSTALDCENWDRHLNSHENGMNRVKHLVIKPRSDQDGSTIRKIVGYISRIPTVKTLEVKTNPWKYYPGFEAAFEAQLESNTFCELQQCHLDLRSLLVGKIGLFPIAQILKAPKIRELTFESSDLLEPQPESQMDHSSTLEKHAIRNYRPNAPQHPS